MKTLELIRQEYAIARVPWNWDEEIKPHGWLLEAYFMFAMVYRCAQAGISYPTGLKMDDAVVARAREALAAIEAAALKQDPSLNTERMKAVANGVHIDNFQKCWWEAQLLSRMAQELSTMQQPDLPH